MEDSFIETDNLNTSSPYSSNKAGSDPLAIAYYMTYGLPVHVTRCTNNFGPYQYPEKLIPFFVIKLMEGKKVLLYCNGLNIRDLIYVEDHCSAIDFVLHNGSNGKIYNIEGGNELTNLENHYFFLKCSTKTSPQTSTLKTEKATVSDIPLTAANLKKWAGNPNMILILPLSKQSDGTSKIDGGRSH